MHSTPPMSEASEIICVVRPVLASTTREKDEPFRLLACPDATPRGALWRVEMPVTCSQSASFDNGASQPTVGGVLLTTSRHAPHSRCIGSVCFRGRIDPTST
jgi:hypothetical protein